MINSIIFDDCYSNVGCSISNLKGYPCKFEGVFYQI